MSWSRGLTRKGFLVLLLAGAASLSACTFSPVHSTRALAPAEIRLAYAEPTTRLEQIVYQELRLRVGESRAPDARLASVSLTTSNVARTMSASANPNAPRALSVTARLTVAAPDGGPSTVITRTATADYTTNPQALASQEARIDAEERAARAVAESLRLALLAGVAQ